MPLKNQMCFSKLFAALPVILMALKEGRLGIVDELDAKLHPKLLRNVIRLFTPRQIPPERWSII